MLKQITLGVLLATALATLGAGPVAAATAPEVQKAASLHASAEEVVAAEGRTPRAVLGRAAASHAAIQAKLGRLMDVKNVHSAQIGEGMVTWERGSRVDERRANRYRVTNQGEVGIVEDLTLIGAEETRPGTQPLGVAGAGMTGSSSFSGGTRLANYCQTWTVSGSNVTACVEKFKPTNDGSSTRDYYAYNRWGTASGKVVDFAPDYKVTKFDMRSRPRAGTTNTKGMNDYFPNDSTQLCNEGGSASLGVGSLSFTIGLTNCSEKYPVPNATTMTMGLVYDAGAVFESRVKGVDYEQEVWAYQGETAPNLGFYNYGKFCQGTYLTCTVTIGTDGW